MREQLYTAIKGYYIATYFYTTLICQRLLHPVSFQLSRNHQKHETCKLQVVAKFTLHYYMIMLFVIAV